MSNKSIITLPHHQQEHSASCVAACVVMGVAHWQMNVSEAEMRRLLKTKPHSGTHPINLINLSELGFAAWPIEGTRKTLQTHLDQRTPVLVFLWTGVLDYWREQVGVDYLHTVVVVGYSKTTFWIHDPVLPDGPISLNSAEFDEAWQYSRQMMVVIKPTENNG